jgi:hypothetical protein
MDEERRAAVVDRQTVAALRKLGRVRAREWALFWVPVLSALFVGYLHLTSPPPSISRATYEQIAAGMSEQEVEGLIRARPGAYGCFWNVGQRLGEEWGRAQRWVWWGDSYGILSVGYDAEGRVCSKKLAYHPGGTPRTPDQWPWWRRLFDRSVPSAQPIYGFIQL